LDKKEALRLLFLFYLPAKKETSANNNKIGTATRHAAPIKNMK
jgi:hypothetical protein